MRGDTSRLPLILAALVGGLALFIAGFIIAAEMRSAAASPTAAGATAPAQAAGRLINLGRITVPVYPNVAWFPFADVSDCSQMRFMGRATEPQRQVGVHPEVYTSPDGVTRIAGDGVFSNLTATDLDGATTLSALIQGPYPYVQVAVWNTGAGSADIDGWLWCVTTGSASAVGGTMELFPSISDSPAHNYAVAAVLAFVAVVAFAAGGWYARRRWLT